VTHAEERSRLPVGLGLKKLGRAYGEMRTTLANRLILEWEDDQITFRLVGSHDDVRRFLKRV